MSRHPYFTRTTAHLWSALAGASLLLGACGNTGFQSALGPEPERAVPPTSGSSEGDSGSATRGSGASESAGDARGARSSGDDVTGRLKQAPSVGAPSEPFFGEGSLCQESAKGSGKGEEPPARRFFHITGNGTSEALDLKAGESLDEVCVFLAGNHTSFSLTLEAGAGVKAFHVIQRGNGSKAAATVAKGGELASARVDQAGNQAFASFDFRDPSKDACAVVRLRQRGGALGVKCSR